MIPVPIPASSPSRLSAGWGFSAPSQVRQESSVVTAQLWVNDKLSLLWQRVGHSGPSRCPFSGHAPGTPKAGTQGLFRLSWAEVGEAVGPFNLIHESPPPRPVPNSEGEGAGHIFKLVLQGVCCG